MEGQVRIQISQIPWNAIMKYRDCWPLAFLPLSALPSLPTSSCTPHFKDPHPEVRGHLTPQPNSIPSPNRFLATCWIWGSLCLGGTTLFLGGWTEERPLQALGVSCALFGHGILESWVTREWSRKWGGTGPMEA